MCISGSAVEGMDGAEEGKGCKRRKHCHHLQELDGDRLGDSIGSSTDNGTTAPAIKSPK